MMPAKIKYEQVAVLREKLERTEAVFVGEYRGMTVAQSTALRVKVRAAGGELKITKNTLFTITTKESGLESLPDSMVTGPNILAAAVAVPMVRAVDNRSASQHA